MTRVAIPLSDRRRLNLGSGRQYSADSVNLDITPDTDPDVVHDLNDRPWPFEDGRFDRVNAIDVLEHLDDPFAAMHEIHRISAPGARITIALPHFSSVNAYTDPTHKSFWAYGSFDYLTGEHAHSYYSRIRFRHIERYLHFERMLGRRGIAYLANRYPQRYERRWAWMFPAWYLRFELEVLKAETRHADTV